MELSLTRKTFCFHNFPNFMHVKAAQSIAINTNEEELYICDEDIKTCNWKKSFLRLHSPYEHWNWRSCRQLLNVRDVKVISAIIIKKTIKQSVLDNRIKGKKCQHEYKSVACEGEQISIDNQLLFQRLFEIAVRHQVELESGYVLSWTVNLLPYATKKA